MNSILQKSAERVQKVLDKFGAKLEVVEMSASTRTSQEAANAVGCQVSQIAKSLIFKTENTERPVLVIASGTNRVNEKKMSDLVGERLEKADAKFVLENAGFAIGGIPPIRRENYAAVYMDEELLKYEDIWAAAGTPHAVFKVSPNVLSDISGASIISIK
jgi:prolyl-tRNA editing enzyme YbaK/EbsC (Cys-tRNA(Pro) deacylase)